MKLAVSNIAWKPEQSEEAYKLMLHYGFTGLEVAPPAIVGDSPYDKIDEAKTWYKHLCNTYGFAVPSMQSIWYQRTENLFNSEEERNILLDYTYKAILWAESINCRNLVLGCPRNRLIPDGINPDIANEVLFKASEFAFLHNTTLSIEANPAIYNTNYINTTKEALELVKEINSEGFRVNLDIGTMVQNSESVILLENNIKYINHIHISEPRLIPVQKRELHIYLNDLLKSEGYDKFISVEMAKTSDGTLTELENSMKYVCEVFK